MDRRCRGANTADQRCDAKPVRPSGWCYWHDPALETERTEGRRQGGKSRSNQARARKQLPTNAMTMQEVQALLGVTFKGVLTGKIEPGVGTACANIARAMTQVAGVAEIEEQIAELRQMIDGRAS